MRVLVPLVLAAFGCGEPAFPSTEELDQLRTLYRIHTPQTDLTNRVSEEPAAQALGERLFHDPGLSACGTVSCESCHLAPGYADTVPLSEGCGGQTARHAPTLLNAAFNEWQMWDGRADTLWSQALLPLQDPAEMAGTPALFRARLQESYSAEYASLFGVAPEAETDDKKLLANLGKTLGAYVGTLRRIDAPFDDDLQRFIAAAEAGQAEDDPAYLGLKVFVRKGQCIACHKGPMLSDGDYHNVRLRSDVPDPGRIRGIDTVLASEFNGAGPWSDDPQAGRVKLDALAQVDRAAMEGAFKTPSLRNLTLTAPYMHDGRFATLREVIDFYNEGGDPDGTFPGIGAETVLELDLTEEEIRALEGLLESMTGPSVD